jgi:peptidoglycan hydrolase CwlO-like protein
MGSVADLVEELEEKYDEVREELKVIELRVDDLELQLEDANKSIAEQSAFILWVTEYYAEAEQQYQALCKVRG